MSPWFLFLLIALSVSEARHVKTLSSAIVVGTVYCDTCFQDDFSHPASHFISGATVAVECREGGFRQQVKTDAHGKFKVQLPSSVSKHVKEIKACSVRLVSSSEPYCAAASSATSSSIHLKSRSKHGSHIFSAGFFTFKPLEQPSLCNQKASSSPLDFPPPLQDPITPPELPPLPLPNIPLPGLPPLPVPLPGLPPLPVPLPGLPPLPPLGDKKAAQLAQSIFPPLIPPILPTPPGLFPNPLQPPPLLPNPLQPPPPLIPNPFQPPPAPLFPNPFQPPPAPPTIPLPFQPPPASPAPIFSFPPIPGFTPSPPPPSPPTSLFPPLPLPPLPKIPGIPPASPSSKNLSP